MDKISVIMLTYNREDLVSGMIKCILAQSFTNYEFIIIDNGSTDNSGVIADSYAKKDKRIRVIHQQRGNIGSGRNAGLDAATGDYIAFVDDDDYCEPDYLQFLYDLLIESNADISICGATWSHVEEKKIMTPEEAVTTLLWRKRYNVAFPTKMFKKGLFVNNRFLETGKYDDIYLMPKILSDARKVAYNGLSKYQFNRHENNNSAWTQKHELLDADTLQEYLTVYKERTQWLSEKFPGNADKWRYFNWSFMLSMTEKITRYSLTDCYEIRSMLVAEILANKAELVCCGYLQDYEKDYLQNNELIKSDER